MRPSTVITRIDRAVTTVCWGASGNTERADSTSPARVKTSVGQYGGTSRLVASMPEMEPSGPSASRQACRRVTVSLGLDADAACQTIALRPSGEIVTCGGANETPYPSGLADELGVSEGIGPGADRSVYGPIVPAALSSVATEIRQSRPAPAATAINPLERSGRSATSSKT